MNGDIFCSDLFLEGNKTCVNRWPFRLSLSRWVLCSNLRDHRNWLTCGKFAHPCPRGYLECGGQGEVVIGSLCRGSLGRGLCTLERNFLGTHRPDFFQSLNPKSLPTDMLDLKSVWAWLEPWSINISFPSLFIWFFFGWWYWGLNSGPQAC
jgi:hypothetical protein